VVVSSSLVDVRVVVWSVEEVEVDEVVVVVGGALVVIEVGPVVDGPSGEVVVGRTGSDEDIIGEQDERLRAQSMSGRSLFFKGM
jgi:hypothetical protein